eukprot:scaffold223969_cov30-Tisochrysis_lutea.AAC.1
MTTPHIATPVRGCLPEKPGDADQSDLCRFCGGCRSPFGLQGVCAHSTMAGRHSNPLCSSAVVTNASSEVTRPCLLFQVLPSPQTLLTAECDRACHFFEQVRHLHASGFLTLGLHTRRTGDLRANQRSEGKPTPYLAHNHFIHGPTGARGVARAGCASSTSPERRAVHDREARTGGATR